MAYIYWLNVLTLNVCNRPTFHIPVVTEIARIVRIMKAGNG